MRLKAILREPSKALTIFLPVLIIVAGPSIRHQILTEKATVNEGTAGDVEARNQNAFAMILGEVRATAADLMFIKTEDYFHSGIRYKPHLKYAQMAAADAVGEEHDHHGHEACRGGVPTVIRTASEDFRGFLGELERETKPYRDPKLPHHLTVGTELLPWYRLMTLTDPHNVRGYLIGTMLLTFAKKPDEALAFIMEGIEKNRGNPQAFRLYASLTQVHWKSRRLEKALAAARTGFEIGKASRPKYGKIDAIRNGVKWTDDLENDFMFVARFFPLLLEKKGEVDKALRVANEVASLAPDDTATMEMIQRFEGALSRQ